MQVLVWPASRILEMLSSSPTPFRLCPTASLNALPAFTSTEFLQPIANTPEFGVPFWVLVAPFARPINCLPSITASGNAKDSKFSPARCNAIPVSKVTELARVVTTAPGISLSIPLAKPARPRPSPSQKESFHHPPCPSLDPISKSGQSFPTSPSSVL